MSKEFIVTQITLLERLAIERTGEDDSAWGRFFELYYPAMIEFAKGIGGGESSEDIVQDVLVKLVNILRSGRYERQDGKSFRAYLKTLIRNQMYDLYRRELSRGHGLRIAMTDEIAETTPALPVDFGKTIDEEWATACRNAAVAHVLTKTALSLQSKAVYKAYVIDGNPIDEVARRFGIPKNNVSKIKERVEKMVFALVEEYGR